MRHGSMVLACFNMTRLFFFGSDSLAPSSNQGRLEVPRKARTWRLSSVTNEILTLPRGKTLILTNCVLFTCDILCRFPWTEAGAWRRATLASTTRRTPCCSRCKLFATISSKPGELCVLSVCVECQRLIMRISGVVSSIKFQFYRLNFSRRPFPGSIGRK